MKIRQHLSTSGLYQLIRTGFTNITDSRSAAAQISLPDALMSGFALFSLKDPSLLAFDARRAAPTNIQNIYGITHIPCDTSLRSILDGVTPESLGPVYKAVWRELQRGKVLEPYRFMGKYYLLSPDGTGYFASKKIHCEHCLQKKLKNGETLYYHYMLGAALVHPDNPTVLPLMPEAIVKQDGETKNDCERNAAKRFLAQLRQDHPYLPFLVVEDGLSSNGPHIRELQKHKIRFILGVKPGDHKFLFEQVAQARQEGRSVEFEIQTPGMTQRFHFVNQVPLNASNTDLLVNFLEYGEITATGTQHFSWVTDITICRFTAEPLMRGGRARWKTENETFNTLKNQGYHFEHNFGHGKQHLSVVLAHLMMLAFLVDQVQAAACQLFQAAWAKVGSKIRLWERIRAYFLTLEFASMEMLYRAIAYGYRIEKLVIFDAPS